MMKEWNSKKECENDLKINIFIHFVLNYHNSLISDGNVLPCNNTAKKLFSTRNLSCNPFLSWTKILLQCKLELAEIVQKLLFRIPEVYIAKKKSIGNQTNCLVIFNEISQSNIFVLWLQLKTRQYSKKYLNQ